MVWVSNMNYNSSYYSTESYVSSEDDLVAVYIELEPKNAPGSAIGNRDGSKPKVYCGLAQWNSTTHPTLDYNPEMGHNGMHRLHVTHINGEEEQDLTFESYDTGKSKKIEDFFSDKDRGIVRRQGEMARCACLTCSNGIPYFTYKRNTYYPVSYRQTTEEERCPCSVCTKLYELYGWKSLKSDPEADLWREELDE